MKSTSDETVTGGGGEEALVYLCLRTKLTSLQFASMVFKAEAAAASEEVVTKVPSIQVEERVLCCKMSYWLRV